MNIRKKCVWVFCTVVFGIAAGAGGIRMLPSLAYQTDSNDIVNQASVGYNTTVMREHFPDQTIIPGTDQNIEKTVSVSNVAASGNVPCYVRAKISYSSSDFGTYAVKGRDPLWIAAPDGYFYYADIIRPGGQTKPLMTDITIRADISGAELQKIQGNLDIIIYEESCQAKNPETQKNWTWKEAWSHALGREVTQ